MRAQLSVQEVVLRVAYAELEVVDLDMDVLVLKRRQVVLACTNEVARADEENGGLDQNER